MRGSDAGDAVLAAAGRELARLRAENARLLRLLKLTAREAEPPGPAQAGFFEAPPGAVHAGSPPEVKVAFFAALFTARTDIYAVRWGNARTGQKGWLPAVRRGWRKGARHMDMTAFSPVALQPRTALCRHRSARHLGLVCQAPGAGARCAGGPAVARPRTRVHHLQVSSWYHCWFWAPGTQER